MLCRRQGVRAHQKATNPKPIVSERPALKGLELRSGDPQAKQTSDETSSIAAMVAAGAFCGTEGSSDLMHVQGIPVLRY